MSRYEHLRNFFRSAGSDIIEFSFDRIKAIRVMRSDINIVTQNTDSLIAQGYRLRRQKHRNDFSKWVITSGGKSDE